MDLEEIVSFISMDRPAVGRSMYMSIKKRCEKLAQNPERYRIVPELHDAGIRSYGEIVISPYRIIFKLELKLVYVIAVLDGRRDLESVLFHRLIRVVE